ncbi:MFS transporter [Oerskovia sp. NPDC056781]|uniref:MFS transporter n=1 Tax=Oerskovia sp. NPDC056781 TaxID=3345942 RepID=UPI003673350C
MQSFTTGARRRGSRLAIVGAFLLMVAASAPSPFYPELTERLGLVPVATTSVFAVYAFTMLGALLVAGGLSDVVGRRPVVTVGSGVLVASLVLFWQADDLATLLLARSLQGVAAGLLLPALSAMVVDLASPRRPEAAALWNTVAPMTGLGTGALAGALALDHASEPADVVFGVLAAVFLLVAAVVWSTPDVVRVPAARTPWTVPRLAVPRHVRRRLAVATPAIVAGWATNGLFLALGSSVVASELGATTHVRQSIGVTVFALSGIVASVVLRRRPARVVSVFGTSALGAGTVLSTAALAVHSFPVYIFAAMILGAGFGTAFMGVLQTLMPRVAPTERAAVLAVMYTVSYLSFGVPSIIAGILVPLVSLAGAMTVLGAVIVGLCLVATVARLRVRDDDQDLGGLRAAASASDGSARAGRR